MVFSRVVNVYERVVALCGRVTDTHQILNLISETNITLTHVHVFVDANISACRSAYLGVTVIRVSDAVKNAYNGT